MDQSLRSIQTRPLSASLGIVTSGLVLILGTLALTVAGTDIVGDLVRTTPFLFRYQSQATAIILVLLVAGIGGAVVAGHILVRRPSLFISGWIFSLAIAGARIPGIEVLSVATRYALMLALVGFGLQQLAVGGPTRVSNTQLLGILMLSYEIAHAALSSDRPNAFAMLPMQAAMFVGVFVGLPRLVESDPTVRQRLCRALAITGVIITAINAIGVLLADAPFLEGRLRSWYALPTGFANGYVLCLVPVLWWLLDSRSTTRARLVAGVTLVIGASMLLLSGTRNAAAVAVFSATLLVWLFRRRYLPLVAGGALLGAALVVFLDLGVESRLLQISSRETRFEVWRTAWQFIQEKPIFGYGIGRQLTAFDPDWNDLRLFDTHNTYIGLWLYTGVVGLGLILAICVSAIVNGSREIRANRRAGVDSGPSALFVCLVAAILAGGLFEANLYGRGSIHQALWATSVGALIIGAARGRRA